MKRKNILVATVVAACIAGLGAWSVHQSARGESEKAAEGAESKADDAVCLVRTQAAVQQNLPLTLIAFGDVIPGKVVAASFPQAGQISQLLVVAGRQVHRGEVLATIVSDPAAESAYTQAASAANLARAELQRSEDMFKLQLATQSQVDTARKALHDADANLESQKKLGGAQATASLLAPFDGVVTETLLAQGERIQPGAAIVKLGRTDTLRIQFGIEPSQSRGVHTGMPVSIFALQDPTKPSTVKLTEVQDVVDPKTKLVTAIAEIKQSAAPTLVIGMHAQGAIQLGQRRLWAVARQAVLTDGKGAYIFQVAAGKAVRVEVEKMTETADVSGVEGKLDPKLPVVILGNYELQDGMAVREAAR
ncbi:MAG TPA: efflux RND transporter periplasmic adaptor subunit [Burkholderiaceae bacterium]|jgi:RND family efflux transporter MFP subunit